MGGAIAGAVAGGMAAMGLTRAKIALYEPILPAAGGSTTAPSPGPTPYWEIDFDYNPKELVFTRSAEYQPVSTAGSTDAPQLQFKGPKSGKQTFELYHSIFEPANVLAMASPIRDVEDIAKHLFSMCAAHSKFTETDTVKYPPFVKFSWGTFVSDPCFCDDVEVKYVMFLPGGKPIRISAKITLSAAVLEKKLTNPTSGGRTNRKTHMLLAGETLATVAFKELNNAALWRAIAEENGIDDPMRVPAGTELLIPSLRDL